MNIVLKRRQSIYAVTFLLLAVLFCTYIRVSLLIIYPLVVLSTFYICGWKLQRNALYILAFVFFCWLISFRHGFHLKYNIVSFYYFLPFFLLLFAAPHPKETQPNYLRMFVKAITIVAVLNNIPGIIQYAVAPGDDRFVGIYGVFTVSQNGLSILNAILFFYYLNVYIYNRAWINMFAPLFFIICCVLGFYGAGQLILVAALMLTYLKIKWKNLVQLFGISVLTLSVVVILMHLISPSTLEYNINILRKFLNPFAADAPRKLTAFQNYFIAYPSNSLDFLFGSGPGTFNSRSAFMVGSPSYFNVDFIKSDHQPFYFKNYAYPLWNETNTGPYDGFMNQPFSSILALLGEYGLLVTAMLLALLIYRFNYFKRIGSMIAKSTAVLIESKMYVFCSIYTFLLIVVDNYIEYPEIIGLLLIIIKLSQQELSKALNFRFTEEIK